MIKRKPNDPPIHTNRNHIFNIMSVPEKTNRLLHEIKRALPYWEERFDSFDPTFLPGLDREDTISKNIIDADEEVREALKNLIKAIQEEG